MGNFFLGFPVPRAKIAEMIEGAAPPLEHIVNHLPPGSDPLVLPGNISSGQIIKWNGNKFVGTDEPAGAVPLSPISIHASSFQPEDDQIDYIADRLGLRRRSDLGEEAFYSPVMFPHGVTVSKVTMVAYRNDAAAALTVHLLRVDSTGSHAFMATLAADWTDGAGSIYDDSISYATIDNANYSYCLDAYVNPNDNIMDVVLFRIQIDFS